MATMTAGAKRGAKSPRPGSKGERTREAILAHAPPPATRIGFAGLTIGRLAEDLHMSKSRLLAHLRSKVALQGAARRRGAGPLATAGMKPAPPHPRRASP